MLVASRASSVVRGRPDRGYSRYEGARRVGFELHPLAGGVLPHQDEIPVVGHQDLSVASPILETCSPAAVTQASSPMDFTSITPREGVWPARGDASVNF